MIKFIKALILSCALCSLFCCTLSNPSDNAPNHSASSSPKKRTNGVITIGSSKAEVAKIQGTPKSLYPHAWFYHDGSVIYFDNNNRVLAWSNDGCLKVSINGAT